MVSEKDYCSKICKAGCCYIYTKDKQKIVACPQLDLETNLCKIYKERYVNKMPFSFRLPVIHNNGMQVISGTCGSVTRDLLGKNVLPEEIERKCCYRKPSLLNKAKL